MAFGTLSPRVLGLLSTQSWEPGFGYHTSPGGSKHRKALAAWPLDGKTLHHLGGAGASAIKRRGHRRVRGNASEGRVGEPARQLAPHFGFLGGVAAAETHDHGKSEEPPVPTCNGAALTAWCLHPAPPQYSRLAASMTETLALVRRHPAAKAAPAWHLAQRDAGTASRVARRCGACRAGERLPREQELSWRSLSRKTRPALVSRLCRGASGAVRVPRPAADPRDPIAGALTRSRSSRRSLLSSPDRGRGQPSSEARCWS